MNATSTPRKRALVTGGNKGIGLAICQGLLAAEFEVILAARSIDKAKTAIDKLQSERVHPLILDVADDDSIDRAANDFGTYFSQLDALINNAGIYPDADVNILTIDRELLDRTMNTNTFGAIQTTQAFLPYSSRNPLLSSMLIFSLMGITELEFIHADSLSMGDEARNRAIANAQAAIKTAVHAEK